MNFQGDIIPSICKQLDIIENLKNELGSTYSFTRNKAFLSLKKALEETVKELHTKIETVKEEIKKLSEDIQRVKSLQEFSIQSPSLFCGFSCEKSLAGKKRYLLAQRNMLLKHFFHDLKQKAQENSINSNIFFKLIEIQPNDFGSMNTFVIENFRELKLYNENTQSSKPNLTITTTLSSFYPDISIHTPLKQITKQSIISPPPLNIYKPEYKSFEKNYNSDLFAKLTKVNIQSIQNNENFQVNNGCSKKQSIIYNGLMSPIHLINKANNTSNNCQEIQDSVNTMITPTKHVLKSSTVLRTGEECVVPCNISSELLKFH